MIVDVDITYEQLCKIALEFTIDCETGEITITDWVDDINPITLS